MRNTPVIVPAIALFLATANLKAQVPALEWQHCLGGVLYEDSQDVMAMAGGGCVVLGTVGSMEGDVIGSHGPPDIWLIKLDANGQILWQHCYGGTEADIASRLLHTSDGGYLILGKTWSVDGDVDCTGVLQQAWAVKVDSAGTIQWQACLAGGMDGSAASFQSAVETADGGYLAAGQTFASDGIWDENHGQSDFFAAKLSATGAVEWLHCYGGSGPDEAWAIRCTPDGNYVIAGTTGSTNGQVTTGNTGQVWVIKIDGTGNLIWNHRMGGSGGGPDMNDLANDLIVCPDGRILVVGSTASNEGDVSGNHGGYDAWLVVLDNIGAIVRQRCIGGTDNDQVWSGTASGLGRFVLAGTALSNDGDLNGLNSSGWNVWTLIVDTNLVPLWQHCYGGAGVDDGYAVARNVYGEIFISGRTMSNDGDVSGNHTLPGEYDIWAIKLSSDISVDVVEPILPKLITAYPSPADDVLNIRLPEALQANASMEVQDITGRKVLQQQIGSGTTAVQIPVGPWVAGMYSLHIRTASTSYSGKFVKH